MPEAHHRDLAKIERAYAAQLGRCDHQSCGIYHNLSMGGTADSFSEHYGQPLALGNDNTALMDTRLGPQLTIALGGKAVIWASCVPL